MQELAKSVVYLAFDSCVWCDPLARDILHMSRRVLSGRNTPLMVVQPGNTRWDAVLEVTNSFPALIYNGKAYNHMDRLLDALGGGEE